MLRRLLSAAAVVALLANPVAIWAQAGACMQLCLASCNRQMMAAHNHAPNASNSAPHTASSTTAQSHHSHCDPMQQTTSRAANSTHAASAVAQAHQTGKLCHVGINQTGNQPAHSQKPVAPCCQSTHNTHVMDAGVSPALLIGLLPENFAFAQLHAIRQRVPLDSPTQLLFVSSPPFEPPRS